MFATEEQKKRLRKPEPVSFQNIHYQDGRIYAVSAGGKDNVRVINSIGNNIFPSGSYGEREIDADTGLPVEPILADIAVDARQTVTVAQENNSRIYQYDMDGNLLAVFGGKGKTAGYFDLIASIAMDGEGRLYVLDAGQQNIQVLEPTRFTSASTRPASCTPPATTLRRWTCCTRCAPWPPLIRWCGRRSAISSISRRTMPPP